MEKTAAFAGLNLHRSRSGVFEQVILILYSRSTAELDGGEGTSWTVGVVKQLLDRDADRDYSDRVGVRLVKDSTQTLDSLGLCQGSLHGVHGLEQSQKMMFKWEKPLFKQVYKKKQMLMRFSAQSQSISPAHVLTISVPFSCLELYIFAYYRYSYIKQNFAMKNKTCLKTYTHLQFIKRPPVSTKALVF